MGEEMRGQKGRPNVDEIRASYGTIIGICGEIGPVRSGLDSPVAAYLHGLSSPAVDIPSLI